MDAALTIAALAAAHLVAAISPGPAFVDVLRSTVGAGRYAGLGGAAGVGLGALVWAAAAVLGLQALLAEFRWLYEGFRFAGAAYLAWLAVRIWQGAPSPLTPPPPGQTGAGFGRALLSGLLVQLANPKAVIFFGSIFVALLPADPPGWLIAAILANVLLVECGWFAVVALCFSTASIRALYARAKIWLDRACAAALGGLSLRLVLADR